MIATNREVTADMAAQVAEVFTEVIVAPSFAPTRWKFCNASRTSESSRQRRLGTVRRWNHVGFLADC